MTIEEERVVDFVGFSKRSGTRIMIISDHLEWKDYESHSTSLQDKINYYLEYIYANWSNEAVPGTKEEKIRIQLIMKHEPTGQAMALLLKIKKEIERLGFEFVHDVFYAE